MASPEPETAASSPAAAVRERWTRLVFLGLLLLIVGFTAAAFANGLYPCVPGVGSTVEPPLADCAVSVSPWAAVAIVGLLLAGLAYRRVG